MNISIKNFEDIEKMRIAGKLAAEVLEMITPFVKPGVSTGELDKLCYDHIVNVQNAIPAQQMLDTKDMRKLFVRA